LILAQASYDYANTISAGGGGGPDQYARDTANTALIIGQSSYNYANTIGAGTIDQTARNAANASFQKANTGSLTANSAFNKANSGYILAQASFNYGNTVGITAQAAFNYANTIGIIAQAAFNTANNKVAKSGDTMSGTLTVTRPSQVVATIDGGEFS
jgi:hypothetical protein